MKKLKTTVASMMALTLISGCGAQGSNEATTVATTATGTTEVAKDGAIYPLAGEKKLTYWVGVTSGNTATNNDEIPMWQELQKATGIDLEFIHSVSGQEAEQFNLMLASGDYPDIIESKMMETGTLFDKGVIADLTDVMPEFSPNYYNYLKANPDIMRQVQSDEGKLMVYPLLRPNPISQTTTGPIIRKDWLDQLGLETPETISEWDIMLRKFKDELNVEIPLGTRSSVGVTSTTNQIAGAWGISLGNIAIYHDEGVVKYGYYEPAFKDYITTMATWYKDGLIDKNFASADKKTQDANVLNNKQGATFGAVGGNIGTWMIGAKANGNNEFNLVGAKFPVLNKGDVPQYYDSQFEFSNGNAWAMISAKTKDKEAAARLLDYTYGEEGGKLMNFGMEGKTYSIKDGNIVPFSDDEITKLTTMSVSDYKKNYSRSASSGPFILDNTFMSYSQTEEQMEALENWSQNENKEHKMPPIILLAEESAEYTAIMADITTYNQEMVIKFIMNVEPLENVEKYWANLKGMNIERAIEIQQGALDRYNKR